MTSLNKLVPRPSYNGDSRRYSHSTRPIVLRARSTTALLHAQAQHGTHPRDRQDHLDGDENDEDEDITASEMARLHPGNDLEHLDMQGYSLAEQKCMLINREIDRMGMGRYQWCIWFLCGFGYLIDLLWAQAFGLVLAPLQQEFGFASDQSGNISSSFNAGLCAGAAFWGIAVDIVGRRWAFNLTVLCSSVFGLCLGASNSYTTFLVLTAFVGFGVGGNIPIDTTITLESIGERHRKLLPLLSIFQPLGVVIVTAIAYGFVPKYGCKPDFTTADPLPSCNLVGPGVACCGKENNWGWRYVLFTTGGITLLGFIMRFVLFSFQESPKFSISKGKDRQALQALQYIAKFNKSECSLDQASFDQLSLEPSMSKMDSPPSAVGEKRQVVQNWRAAGIRELGRFKLFFSTFAVAKLTILVWLIYICDYWGFTVAGTYLPMIIAKKNGALNLSIEHTYRSYVYIYLPGVAGVLLGVLGYDLPRVGRKYTMFISAGLMGASIFLFSAANSDASNTGLNAMEYFFQSAFNAVLYGWTPEAFSLEIRGTACGVASFWGRLAGIISPIIAGHLLPPDRPGVDPTEYNKVLYLAGGVSLGCCLWILLLPTKQVQGKSI